MTLSNNEGVTVVPETTLPLVSVLIPAYNHEKYIERCLKSIWQQDYENIEVIIINDGSTDNTAKVLDSLKAKSKYPIQVFHQNNAGLCKTLNKLSRLASGKYIMPIASDDEFYRGRIKAHVRYLETIDDPTIAGCYGQQQIIDKNSNIKTPIVKRRMEFNNQHKGLLEGAIPFYLQGTTFFSSIFKKYEFDENLAFEDWDFYLRLTLHYKLAYLPGIAFRYRGHEEGLNRNMEKMAAGRLEIFEKFKDYKSVVDYGKNRFLSNVYIMNAKGYFNIENYQKARECIFIALKYNSKALINEMSFIYKPFLGRSIINILRRIKGA